MSKTCYCPNCAPEHKFNSLECMFCGKNLPPKGGNLKSANGARMCATCRDECARVLKENEKHETQGN